MGNHLFVFFAVLDVSFAVNSCLNRSFFTFITYNKCIGDDTKAADCTLQCGMWLWNHDSEFTKWQHPAMWQVALG